MLIASNQSFVTIIIGLNVLSFGAFFTHFLAYGWVSQKAEIHRNGIIFGSLLCQWKPWGRVCYMW